MEEAIIAVVSASQPVEVVPTVDKPAPKCWSHNTPLHPTQGFLEQSGHQLLPTTKWVCKGGFCEFARWDRAAPGAKTHTDPKWLAKSKK